LFFENLALTGSGKSAAPSGRGGGKAPRGVMVWVRSVSAWQRSWPLTEIKERKLTLVHSCFFLEGKGFCRPIETGIWSLWYSEIRVVKLLRVYGGCLGAKKR
jgi:hypothetical protein